MHTEGINFRLLPFTNSSIKQASLEAGPINIEKSMDLVMNKYQWGGAERNDIHFDDKHTTMMISYRLLANWLSGALVRAGRNADAVKVLDKVTASMSEHSYPYDMSACYLAAGYYGAGAKDKAVQLADKIIKNLAKDIDWINTLNEDQQRGVAIEIQTDLSQLNILANAARQSGDAQHAEQWGKQLETLYNKMLPVINSAK
jgi:tetratricopeptide (TPR) repeat protein